MRSMVEVSCETCGKSYKKREAEVKRSPRHFCSRKCHGQSLFSVTDFWSSGLHGPNGCLLWSKAKNRDGYGIVSYGGKKTRAHLVSWRLTNGPIPKGKCVCHSCDTPSCYAPSHLFLGTHQENMKDMKNKGRGASKLSSSNIDDIKRSQTPTEILAKRYNVSTRTIRYHRKGIRPLPPAPKGDSNAP